MYENMSGRSCDTTLCNMPNTLSNDQLSAYRRDGLLFPLPALSADEVPYYRHLHDELDRHLGDKPTAQQKSQCHLRFKWVCDLATHSKILDAVEQVLGPDILIHSSTIFCKYANDEKFVSWHQDSHYWGLSEPRLVSAWIALTDSTVENGCLRVLPGTHTRRFDHIENPQERNILGKGLTVSEDLVVEHAVDVTLRAGEMSFHHANIVHGSNPNTTASRRVGFAVRYVAAAVKQTKRHHAVILARGQDKYHFYEIQDKPTASIQEGMLAQALYESEPRQNFDGVYDPPQR
jgi:non-haem Fe2+, alpha-ketoglutarate-dependent halogenase